MGKEVKSRTFSRAERMQFRERLGEDLASLRRHLDTADFADTGSIGLELELNLVESDYTPSLRNTEVLDLIADEAYQSEMGAFNIEFNHPVVKLDGDNLIELEESLATELGQAEAKANSVGVGIVMAGMLPTLTEDILTDDNWRSPGERYAALNDSILNARGEDLAIEIDGIESIDVDAANLAPEAACTSVQLHLQVAPADFGSLWNTAQAIAGPQVALAANSPIFLEKMLWHESRIEVFKQSIDTRPPELVEQGVRPRTWFGERWIESIADLFEENVRYFPSLLPELSDEADREHPEAPPVPELLLHNGTVYRWNRPIYQPAEDGELSHLRIENRLLPAGPTPIDTVANAAFFFGLVHKLRRQEQPIWERMSFQTANDNFTACARYGLGAWVYWPGVGDLPITELLVRHLIPMAAQGLQDMDVSDEAVERYTSVLNSRARSEQTGAAWQIKTLKALESDGMSRREALKELTRRYSKNMLANTPVHLWK